MGCIIDLLKCFDRLLLVSQLTVHFESQEVNLKLVFLTLINHGTALLDHLTGLLEVTELEPSIGSH